MKTKPKSQKRDPASRRGKPFDPLTKKGRNFKFNINNRKTTKKGRKRNRGARNKPTFITPEEGESQKGEFLKNPSRHMDKGGNIPNTGKGHSISHEGLATKRKDTGTPRLKDAKSTTSQSNATFSPIKRPGTPQV